MASMVTRLRRGLFLARAFSTTNSFSSSSFSGRFVPKNPLACNLLWGLNSLLTQSHYMIARRTVSNSRPVYSPVDTGGPRGGRGDTEILFEGCDYEHWLITMEFPDPQPTREEKIDTFIKTLAKVVGSEEEAKKRIYALSTTTYTGFQAQISEETSEKMKGLPGVVWVLPDSYIDPVNKEYGGDKYINGVIIPDTRVYNNRPSGRYNDRPRNRMRRDSMPVERRDGMQGGRDYRPPMEGRGPMPGGDPQGFRPPPMEGRGPMPEVRQDYRRPPVDGRGPIPGDRQDYRPPMDARGPMPGGDSQSYRPLPMEGRGQDYRSPPVDGRGPMPGDRQDYRPPPQDYRRPQDYRSPAQDYSPPAQDYSPPAQDYRPPSPPQDFRPPPPPQDYRPPSQDYRPPMQDYRPPVQDYRPPVQDYRPPMDGRGRMTGYGQDYGQPMDGRSPIPNHRPPMEGRGTMQGDPMQGEQKNYGPPGGPAQGSSMPVQGEQEPFPWPIEGSR